MDNSGLPIDIFNDSSQSGKSFNDFALQHGVNLHNFARYFYQGPIVDCDFYQPNKTDLTKYAYFEKIFVNYGAADDVEKTILFNIPGGFLSSDIEFRRPVASFDVGGNDLHNSSGFLTDIICNFFNPQFEPVNEQIRLVGWTAYTGTY